MNTTFIWLIYFYLYILASFGDAFFLSYWLCNKISELPKVRYWLRMGCHITPQFLLRMHFDKHFGHLQDHVFLNLETLFPWILIFFVLLKIVPPFLHNTSWLWFPLHLFLPVPPYSSLIQTHPHSVSQKINRHLQDNNKNTMG